MGAEFGNESYYGETWLGGMIVFYLVYILVMLAVSVGTYVLQSLGMYTIAKRRGIQKPWLAWIPVGSSWILGCISDQYRYVAKGQIRNKRKAMLVLTVLTYALVVAFYVLFGAVMVQAIVYEDTMLEVDHAAQMNMIGSVFGMLGVALVMLGLAIALAVIQYMALYDLYHSCEPRNSTLYLVLNIFVGITLPIFLFICRNKDEGMPPRKAEPECIREPVCEPWEKDPEQ